MPWPFKARSKGEAWDDWEIESEEPFNYGSEQQVPYGQQGWNPNWQGQQVPQAPQPSPYGQPPGSSGVTAQPRGTPQNEEDQYYGQFWGEEEAKSRGISLKAFIILAVLFLYLLFLSFGVFSTDYKDGKGYVVPGELRVERGYISAITPYYQTLVNMPSVINNLEATDTNDVDVEYHLQQYQQTLTSLATEQSKRTVPELFAPFTSYLNSLARQEIAYIEAKIQYHQDHLDQEIAPMQQQASDIQYRITQSKSQMDSIEQELVRNQTP